MMKNSRIVFMLLLISSTVYTHGQSNGLTGSPYSLFGLGVQSNSSVGRFSSMARTGIALSSGTQINLSNPASFAGIEQKRFLFDIGGLTEINSLSDRQTDDERRVTGNFSSLAIAFSINSKSNLGISLIPETNVGYALTGIETPVEGSTETFVGSVIGSGALNTVAVDYGYRLSKNIHIGAKATYLFGKITENENVSTQLDALNISEENFYSGIKLGLGIQTQITPKIRLGIITELPSTLGATQDRNVSRTLDSSPNAVEIENGIDINDFKLPLQIGSGLNYTFREGFNISFDYRKYFWNATDQSDNVGEFIDQDIISLGGEFTTNPRGLRYWEHISFRGGINYDTGYLKVENTTIDRLSASIGIGIPVGKKGNQINFSYTRALRGEVENILVQENQNLFNINLSFKDIWFVQRKFN